ncbi:hypothetical protein ABBQ32_003456 [Trebouxia sp. C0010 RCD-2024]
MLSCICCGPLPLEGGIPGHINFQDQKARQKHGHAAAKPELTLQEQRARRVQASISLNQGRLILSGVLTRANAVTTNKRVYQKDTILREVERYQQSHIQHSTAYGELDHPSYDSITFRELHMATVSHQVLQVWWHGDDLHGLVEVLDTPAGRLVRGLYCQGFMFGASSRGWSCTVPQQDYSVIADDFQLFAFDLLLRPATTSYLFPVRERFQVASNPDLSILAAANRGSQGVVPCYPTLRLQAMRDARELHADLKRAASLKVMQQQQVEAEEQQSIPEEPRSGLRGSLSSAVKTHLGFGKHSSKGNEALLPRHKRSSSQGLTAAERQTSAIKAVHPNSRQGSPSPKKGSSSMKSPVRDVQHRLQKTQKLLDVLQFGQLHEQVSGRQQGYLEKFLVEVLAAQDYRNAPQSAVRQIPALRKVPELQSLLPPERRTPTKGGVKPGQGCHRDKDHAPGGYVPLMESASSVASVGLMDESQLQETAPVMRVSGELLRSQLGGDTSKPQPITM